MARPTTSARSANARIALIAGAGVLVMVGLAFAAVPFYRAFCQATGFNGTVRTGPSPSAAASRDTVTVRFDTNVNGLAWRFRPLVRQQTVRLGEAKLAFFLATNTGPASVTGRAVFNVLPEFAGAYFSKLQCFCFKNQTIGPGQTVQFPVVYFVDPRYAKDPDRREKGLITLSYTFFPAVVGPRVEAQTGAKPSALGGGGGRRL